MLKTIKTKFSVLEKVFLVLFSTILFLSGFGIAHRFWIENTDVYAADGGEFLEAAFAKFDENFKINPLFTFGVKSNSVEADLVQLIFAGLMRYNPETGQQEDFLADHTLSGDKKLYTFTLKEGLMWHDGYPITADDVVFTFRDIIQHPDFENEFLKAAFEGVEIKKIDEQTITFEIEEPYKFFLTNLTVGIVPRHLLLNTPVKNLSLDSFNQEPIGAGPFQLNNISLVDPSFDEIRLSKFKKFALTKPKVDFITFRLYQQKRDLIADMEDFDGLRPMLEAESDFLPDNSKFEKNIFQLPQYIALFINMNDPLFAEDEGQKMRWALQLSTDKNAILEEIPGVRIDSPLLEISSEDWLSEPNYDKARGALKDSGWSLPELVITEEVIKDEPEPETTPEEIIEEEETEEVEAEPEMILEETVEPEPEMEEEVIEEKTEEVEAETIETKYIYEPTNADYYETIKTKFFIVGTRPAGTASVQVNNYTLQLYDPTKGTWSYNASLNIKTIKYGENIYNIEFFDAEGQLLDTDQITIFLLEASEAIETSANETEEKEHGTAPEENENKEVEKEPIKQVDTTAVRIAEDGSPLTLTITTADNPLYLQKSAEILKKQWRQVGIDVQIEALSADELLQKIKDRDYQLLLYGQNLGYNLDAFSYWHLSQAKEGLNLSEYKNFEASVLLEEIRQTHDEELRQTNLEKLQAIIKEDTPAVFLYAPNYILNISKTIKNVQIERLALYPDRFADIEKWYIKSKRDFKEDQSWLKFPAWIINQIF